MEKADSSNTEEEDIRQIEAVTRILGNEFHMEVAKFTSEENVETRCNYKKNSFKREIDYKQLLQSSVLMRV